MIYKCINIEQIRALFSRLYAQNCLLCGLATAFSDPLCEYCEKALPRNRQSCPVCAAPVTQDQRICGRCLARPPYFDSTLAPFLYREGVSQLIQQFKFEQNLAAGRLLSRNFYQALDSGTAQAPEALIPIPSHNRRVRERGLDSALWLARQLGHRSGIAVDTRWLYKNRETPDQHGLSGQRRRTNLHGSFSLRGERDYRHVAIVDDVFTTGSTANTAARLLRGAGCEKVSLWAMARTPPAQVISR